jgi:hypothetical protein
MAKSFAAVSVVGPSATSAHWQTIPIARERSMAYVNEGVQRRRRVFVSFGHVIMNSM